MNYRIFMITILFIAGCTTSSDFTILTSEIQLTYKDSNNLETSLFKRFENDYRGRYQITSETKKDTTFLILKRNEELAMGFPPWRYDRRLKTTTLTCPEKIRIETGRLSFYFCYSDVLIHIQQHPAKNDVAYSFLFQEVEKLLINLKENRGAALPDLVVNERIISELLRHINFDIKDSGGEVIEIISIGEIYSGWSKDFEYYFMNTQNDTIAAFSYNEWVQ
ncbi:hypothetical protein [uncultured Kordia sp.]|uniref:hypothetical protein n=1 Tax=uncultured Kordia sp. TaxID=507699 RepID=UPI0026348752|nr:hypothetical protein [uncultured Kordia sp.]